MRILSAIGAALLIPALMSCGADTQNQPGEAAVPVIPGPPCLEWQESLHSWQEGFTRSTVALDDSGFVTAEDLITLATELAAEIPPGDLQDSFLGVRSGRPGNNDTPDVDGVEQVIETCNEHGVDVTQVEYSAEEMQAFREEKRLEREAARDRGEGPTAPERSDTSPSESLQVQALEEMWATTSEAERVATCEVYAQSPDSLIDGFMSSAGGAFSEPLVRRFYDGKC